MSRLTKKQGNLYYPTNENIIFPDDGSNAIRLLQVIGKYEELEEELGIALITLFKALKNGIYSRDHGRLLVEHFVLKHKQELHCRPTYRNELRFALKDYKKTWWLKEDLENGN